MPNGMSWCTSFHSLCKILKDSFTVETLALQFWKISSLTFCSLHNYSLDLSPPHTSSIPFNPHPSFSVFTFSNSFCWYIRISKWFEFSHLFSTTSHFSFFFPANSLISFFVCRFPQLYFPNISLPLCQFCLLNNDVQVNNNELSKEGCGESSLLVVAHFLRASISAMPDFKPPTLYPWKQSWGEKHSSVSLC